ncbi:hypothetical protein [Bradyrhizobium sp. WSM1253]|uniref:hypothetical protein n=1 Tax=Bradyrhizobium sp. WSM1253 TaxID=319003 RepID=UPI0009FD1094
MSYRITVFNKGAIQQLAAPAELYEQPSNAYIAQFVGRGWRAGQRSMDGKRTIVERSMRLDSGPKRRGPGGQGL